jgi:hypothetical protein
MTTPQATQPVPSDDDGEWTTEVEESAVKVNFDTVGDRFTGIKVGSRLVEFEDPKEGHKEFTVYQFRAWHMEAHGLDDGTLCDIQESYKLQGLKDIENGVLVRITRMADVPTGRPQPMKDFRIESRRI